MTYILYTHDSWGRADVGRFATLEQAREVYEALCNDRWCHDDGTIRAVSIEEDSTAGRRVLARYAFPGAGDTGPAERP